VGPYRANCFLVSRDSDAAVLVVDPGAEPERILGEIAERRLEPSAILVTHGHVDHVGGVASVKAATGVRVYMPAGEADRLAAPPDVALQGGEQLEIGPFSVRVLAVPGHSPAHVAYLIEDVLLSGDVLFAGSVGRTDLEGSDPAALDRTLRMLVETLPPETRVFPGHGPATTIARERAANPFLAALR
jgi:glyoxylase-like metal-dependent hydrolase (beta-lactamase superfamily II)